MVGVPNEKEPSPRVPETFVPRGVRHKISGETSWVSIAKSIGIDPWTLIDFNFPGTKQTMLINRELATRHVNWYLREYVGCRVSLDGNNWSFVAAGTAVGGQQQLGKGAWKDGVVYLPSPASGPAGSANAPPPKDSTPTVASTKALDDWLLSVTEGHAGAKEPWTFYEEIEAYLGPFGADGYPIGYGKKYCIAFNQDKFLSSNPVAKAWVRRTTILLQTYLRQYIVERYRKGTLDSLTESELREAAFASHPRAYTKGGLTLVVFLAPHLLPVIASIPAVEFGQLSSWTQAITTLEIVVRESIGTVAAGGFGPAHTGSWSYAHQKDRLAFRRSQQLGQLLGDLKEAMTQGKLDRIVWLRQATRKLNEIEFPNDSLKKFASEIVSMAGFRMRALAQHYLETIRLAPDLEAHYDTYDPGWRHWSGL